MLSGHEHPDGDCLGSQLGLFHLIRSWGGEVRILNPDPPARHLAFLADWGPIEAYDSTSLGDGRSLGDLLVLMDCSQLRRLGDLGSAIRGKVGSIAVVDHHVDADRGDGDTSFVDVSAAATGELVLRLYDVAGVQPGFEAAHGLFVSLVADTGWFRYSNTTAEVFARATQLVRSGVDPSQLYDAMHRRNEAGSVAFLGESIGASEFRLDGQLGMLCLDAAAIARGGRAGVDLDVVMEPLRSVAGVEVVAMLKESAPGRIKVSLRSQGDLDVQRLALELGGGGHQKAAGATVDGGIRGVAARVESLVAGALTRLRAGGDG